MHQGFQITYRHSAGNLHIRLSGAFNGMCAWGLLKTLKREYAGTGRIFVDTADLEAVMPTGVALFKGHMARIRMPSDCLYLKGEKGLGMAPNGSRVIICKKSPRRKPHPFRGHAPNRKSCRSPQRRIPIHTNTRRTS